MLIACADSELLDHADHPHVHGPTHVTTVETVTHNGRAVEAASGQIIVEFRDDAVPSERQAIVLATGGTVLQYSQFTGSVLIEVAPDAVESAIAQLNAERGVKEATPNAIVRASGKGGKGKGKGNGNGNDEAADPEPATSGWNSAGDFPPPTLTN